MIAFRDHLLRHRTLEAAYLDLVPHGLGKTPPLFLNQLVHVILRNALDGCEDPFVLRAAELFFRTQRMTLHDGSLIAADEETIGGANADAGVAAGLDARHSGRGRDRHHRRTTTPSTIVERSDQFDMAIDLTAGRRGPRGAGRGDAALDRASARRRGRRSSRSPNCAMRSSPGMSGSTPRRTRIGDHAVERRGARRGSARRAWSACSA